MSEQKKGGFLRTPETEARYQALKDSGEMQRGCALCAAETIKEYEHWRVIPNRFPYDAVASVHDMLVPKRHAGRSELTQEERKELEEIQTGFNENDYQYIMEAIGKYKSIPSHFHLHLIVLKV